MTMEIGTFARSSSHGCFQQIFSGNDAKYVVFFAYEECADVFCEEEYGCIIGVRVHVDHDRA